MVVGRCVGGPHTADIFSVKRRRNFDPDGIADCGDSKS